MPTNSAAPPTPRPAIKRASIGPAAAACGVFAPLASLKNRVAPLVLKELLPEGFEGSAVEPPPGFWGVLVVGGSVPDVDVDEVVVIDVVVVEKNPSCEANTPPSGQLS